jgi:hypothetical protein
VLCWCLDLVAFVADDVAIAAAAATTTTNTTVAIDVLVLL